MKSNDSAQSSKPKKALGRGIGSLLGSTQVDSQLNTALNIQGGSEQQRIWSIPIEKIKSSPWQPRQIFKKEELAELAASIKEKGIIQPVVLRKEGEFYELIAGERRWRAAQMAGLHEVPAVIRKYDDLESMEIAIIENIQRSNLDPIEEALAYQKLSQLFELTQAQIADRVGKARATIANLMRLLSLPQDVQESLRQGLLSTGHAKVLLSISDQEVLKRLAQLAIEKSLSVRELEKIVKHEIKIKSQAVSPKVMASVTQQDGVAHKELQRRLAHLLGTKVEIKHMGDHGQLIVHYFSRDQLNAIVEKLDG